MGTHATYALVGEDNVVNKVRPFEVKWDPSAADPDNNWIMSIDSEDTIVRKYAAQVGGTYDEQKDIFIEPKPYPSWVLNEDSVYVDPVYGMRYAPFEDYDKSNPETNYTWDEEAQDYLRLENVVNPTE